MTNADRIASKQVFPRAATMQPGITLIEYFAGQALAGLTAIDDDQATPAEITSRAWFIATQMIRNHPDV